MKHDHTTIYAPRIIIHGGAGNITQSNLPHERQAEYKSSLLRVINHGQSLLNSGVGAVDIATACVSLFEDDPLFNCGRGAVFTKSGDIELEASVMVSSGYKKRGAAVSLIKHVKNPIQLAKSILQHGEEDMENTGENDSAQGHVHLSGSTAEDLAKAYGLELRPQKYFWTRRRWEEHKRGLNSGSLGEHSAIPYDLDKNEPGWDGYEYLPQGTVGCVVMDRLGVICTATSTGGLTNKLSGRIGDTPTFGAGFWAEEGIVPDSRNKANILEAIPPVLRSVLIRFPPISAYLPSIITDCLTGIAEDEHVLLGPDSEKSTESFATHAVGLSGTGNGDSFLRVAACRTASSLVLPLWNPAHLLNLSSTTKPFGPTATLGSAVEAVAGPNGLLQRSAGDRWARTGEGQGGIIGIERKGSESSVVYSLNSTGMFRGYINEQGRIVLGIFRGNDEIVDK